MSQGRDGLVMPAPARPRPVQVTPSSEASTPRRQTVLDGAVEKIIARGRRAAGAFGRWHRVAIMLATLTLVLLVGLGDYLSGYEISFLIFYLLPVSLAAWFVSRTFAVVVSLASAGVWVYCDLAGGRVYSSAIIPVWNSAIALGFFLVVAWLLSSLRALLLELEIRVGQRTVALTEEMAERERLEKDVLEISEREQRRIGHDLHDGLGQHLTGTALASQVLAERLAAHELPEAADAERIAGLIEDGIELTRSLARGLSPVALDADGLTVALTELADQTTAQFYLPCTFQAVPVRLTDPTAATHLYRIAQEAVGNAIRHGRPNRIEIALSDAPADRLALTIRDDGIGLRNDPERRRAGLGLRIMAHRARMIGARIDVQAGADRGTVVQCSFPKPLTLNPSDDHARTRHP